MKFAKVTERLDGLGSEKWAVHIEGKRRASLGEPMIFLSIGEPDAPPPTAILDEANSNGWIRITDGATTLAFPAKDVRAVRLTRLSLKE